MRGYQELKEKNLVTVEVIENIHTNVSVVGGGRVLAHTKVFDDIRLRRTKFDPNTGEKVDDEVTVYTRAQLEELIEACESAAAAAVDFRAILNELPDPQPCDENGVPLT